MIEILFSVMILPCAPGQKEECLLMRPWGCAISVCIPKDLPEEP